MQITEKQKEVLRAVEGITYNEWLRIAEAVNQSFMEQEQKQRETLKLENMSKKRKLNEELVLLLNKLLPKQAEEVRRAIKSEIPIMLINNIVDDTETVLFFHKALKNAGAIMVPPCIKDYKKENVSFLSIYLNVKKD